MEEQPILNSLTTRYRSHTLMRFYSLTLMDKVQFSSFPVLQEHATETPKEIYNTWIEWFSDRSLATGNLVQMDARRRLKMCLLGTAFTPEQMLLAWDQDTLDYVVDEDLIYIHTHDDTHIPYVEGFGPLEGELRNQLFPTEYDIQFSQDVDERGAEKMQGYLIGHMGCLRFWPSWELDIYTTYLDKMRTELFLLQLKAYYNSQGLPLSPPA